MPERSLRWVQEKTDSSRREKSSRVAALEESGAATWICGAKHRGKKTSGDVLEESGCIPGEKLSSKREKSSQVAALEESGAATRNILSLKLKEKHSGRYLE